MAFHLLSAFGISLFEVHIEIALDHAVVELAALVGRDAEYALKVLVCRYDILFDIGAAQCLAELIAQHSCLLEVKHTHAVGRIAHEHALFAVPPLRLVMGFARRFCAPLFVRPLRAFFVLLALGKAIVA